MNTLFISNSYLKGNSGGIYATRAYINAFADVSESMTLLYPMKDGAEPEGIVGDNISYVPVWDNRSSIRKFVDLLLGITNRFQNRVDKLVNLEDFDTVVFNNSDSSSGLIRKMKDRGLKCITIHHNYQIEYLKGDCTPLLLPIELFWTRIYERDAVRYSDLNLTLTQDDIVKLTQHYGGNNFNVLGVFENKPIVGNLKDYPPRNHNYIITGWLGSKQTNDSLVRWINRYYPILMQEDPLAKLTIAGRDPQNELLFLAEKNHIIIIPSPADMQPLLDQSDYYICPTDCGGGLKLRNLDGLKSGMPVLTHEVSARGYKYMQDIGILYSYNSEETFRAGMRRMLGCRKSRRDIIYEYRNFYSLDVGIKRLKQILCQSQIMQQCN